MINKKLLTAFCVGVMSQPASAAFITSTVTNGNSVEDFGSDLSISQFEVTFNNLQFVQIDFDNTFTGIPSFRDDISMNIYNNTGIGWSGFDFALVGVGIFGPFSVELETGSFSNFVFHENDPATGLASGVTLMFDVLEETAIWNVAGSVDTSFSPSYSLIVTPTTVPVPAAAWLFGSGLLGLIAVARRKSNAS